MHTIFFFFTTTRPPTSTRTDTLLPHTTLSRSIYRNKSKQKPCPIDSEDIPTNTSANEHFQAVVERAYSLRGFLKSCLGLSAAMFLGGDRKSTRLNSSH